MIAVNIRKQGGAAVITIPSDILKILNIHIGTTLKLDVKKGNLVAHPVKNKTSRYSLTELFDGITPEVIADMKAETEWMREGQPIGKEII